MKGKTRLVIVGLVLALGGAVWVAWPWIITKREPFALYEETLFGREISAWPNPLPPDATLGWRFSHRILGDDFRRRTEVKPNEENFPHPRREPDAPWVKSGQTSEQWWDRVKESD